MISELVIAATLVYGPKYIKESQKRRKLKMLFSKVMYELNIKNKSGETYYISKAYDKEYGHFCTVAIPKGLGFEKLQQVRDVLELNLESLIELEVDRFENYAKMTVIKNPKNEKVFEVVPQKPWEFLVGYDRTGKVHKINMNKTAHLLVAGVTGSGKSRLIFIGITNLAATCDEKLIEFYFTQIRKLDFNKFKKLKQTKWYATTLEDTVLMFERLDSSIDRRNDVIEALECENIYEYNTKNRVKMKYKWVLAEEFSFYMPKDGDDDKTKDLKNKAIGYLTRIILSGRNVGIFVLCATQRSTAANIDPTIKSQMNRLTARQKSGLDSHNIIDIPDAKDLKDQEFILNSDAYYWLKAPYIDREIINKTLKNVTIPIEVITNEIPYKEEIKPAYDVEYTEENNKPVVRTNKPEISKLSGVMTLEELEDACRVR